MKIAFVSPFPERLGFPRGGVESVVSQLVLELAKRGHECHVISPSSKVAETMALAPNVYVHRLKKSRIPGAIDFFLWVPWLLRKVLRQIEPDVVHVHGPSVWALASPYPTVLTIHGIVEREVVHRNPRIGRLMFPLIEAVETWSTARLRNIILINPYVRQLRKIVSGHRVWDIVNPIDDVFFSLPQKGSFGSPSRLQLVWVGNSDHRKNFGLLVHLAREIAALGHEFLVDVFGIAPQDQSAYMTACRRSAEQYGVADAFQFHGRVSRETVAQSFDRASALVVTSLQETAPCVVSEALARGLFVIAPSAFGLPFMIADGACGYLYGPDDGPDKIALGMCEALSRVGAGDRAVRQQLATQYRSASICEATLAVYDEVRNA